MIALYQEGIRFFSGKGELTNSANLFQANIDIFAPSVLGVAKQW